MVQSPLVTHSHREDLFFLQPEGPVDMRTVPEIRRVLLGRAKRSEIKEIHVDFSRVTALDTSGVAMFVEIWRSLAQKGGVLRLSGLSENAKRLMLMARLNEVFEISDDPGREV
jgi:anti-sigma B factor antagonist